jgi:mono/diheme cytochrome c family protein
MINRYSFLLIGVAVVAMAVTISGRFFSYSYIPTTGGDVVSYSKDVQPILESRCIICHGVQRIRDGLDLRTYASLMKGSKNGPVVIAGDADNSFLIHKIENGEMPKRGPKMFPAQLRTLKNWINEGAQNN